MNDLSNTAFRHRPDLHVETDGEFKGWRTWSRDSFESHSGPFWHRMNENFGCRPLEGRRGAFGGRRPKPSKGGNRAYGTCGGAAVAMGIWLPRESGLIWIERLQRVVRR